MSLITNIGSGISNDRDCVLSILESLMENSVQQMVKFAVFIKVSSNHNTYTCTCTSRCTTCTL